MRSKSWVSLKIFFIIMGNQEKGLFLFGKFRPMKNTIFLLIFLFTSVTSSARIGWQRGATGLMQVIIRN